MTDEIKLTGDAARGMQADSLLRNDLVQEAYQALEAELVKAWIDSPARDTEGRERLWAAVQANRKHQNYLRSIIDNGKLAEAELASLAKRRK